MLRVNAINRQELLKCLTFNPKSLVIKTVSVPTTPQSYWHELRDHQEYRKKIAMKTGTHTQVPMTTLGSRPERC